MKKTMEKNNSIDFSSLFYPKSIAMIGASSNPTKWGFIVMANIVKGGYKGKLLPVNPNSKEILGFKCYPKISDINDNVDIAIITTPAKTVLGVIDDLIAVGINIAILVTSDFSETGEEGAKLEKEIVEKARAGGLRLIGPNTMGIFSSGVKLTALMPPTVPIPGNVSMISQSGNVGTQMLAWGVEQGIGFSKFVSSGNEGDVTCEDYLEYLGRDDDTKIIVLYLESLDNGLNFIEIAREISLSKPIIVFKGGKTGVGMKAAASHTGAMAGSIEVYRSAFRQAGLIEATDTQEILDLVGGFLSFPLPRANRVTILTRGGGWGVITADECEAVGLKVPPLSQVVFDRLDKQLPKYWSKGNPVDMVAVISEGPFLECLDALASSDGTDAVISLGGAVGEHFIESFKDKRLAKHMGISEDELNAFADQYAKESDEIKEVTAYLMDKYKKPLLNVEIGGGTSTREDMMKFGFYVYPTPERAVRVLYKLYEYNMFRTKVGDNDKSHSN